ncbi:sensor histidine kinase [Streptacidiphilus cavernicola]|uniref:Oxygen sensor histidine kinase NreB n=1 Tax=Streptacidiphilus cavernicola TaxID=3342716 RepID=A0ABV6W4X0_9ACTN
MTSSDVRDADPRDAGSDGWINKVFLMWHVSFAVLVVAAVASLLGDVDGWLVYALVALLCAAYAGLLVPCLARDSLRLGVGYLAVAGPVVLALGYLDPNGLILLYALFPQVFGVLQARRSRLLVLVALAAGAVAVGLRHEELTTAVVQVGIALLVSLLIGTFTQVIMREAERRGRLITELEAARADLDEAQHQAGVLTERQRLSHEIHDTLAQGFTSLIMLIQAADATVDHDPAATRHRLALAERTARENLAETRALVAALAPVDLQSAPLDTALERVTARLGEELGIPARVRIEGTPRILPPDVQVVLLRSAQESLANIRKHAAAGRVDVRLHYADGVGTARDGSGTGVLLEVRDDGKGFSPGTAGGYGLRGMRARVEQVHGTVDVSSAPGEGTTVRVEIP